MEPRIRYTTTSDGVSIAYASLGNGPPVVYSTVLWGDIGFYRSGVRHYAPAAVDYLAESGRSITIYDGRGTGLSDREPADFSAEARLVDLEAVIDALGAAPIDLVGRVQGTAAAIRYSVKYPDRVRHLILWNPFARGADYYSATGFLRGVRAFANAAIDDWEFLTLTVANWALNFSDPDEARTLAANCREGMEYEAYLKALEDSYALDVSDLLPRVSVPTLVIRDTSQFTAAPLLAKPLASRIPGAQFITVDGMSAATSAIVEFTSDAVGHASVGGSAAASGLVTILFTDLASSTALTQRLGDAKAQELVRAHNAIVREALPALGGSEIKHTGDGIMASFPTASGAIECAIAIQRAVAQRDNPDLQVYIGLNAGEPVAEEAPDGRADLFGTSVQLARRLVDHAEAGQVLVSNVVRELAAGKGFLFADTGEVALKGFEEPVHVYEVRWREEG